VPEAMFYVSNLPAVVDCLACGYTNPGITFFY